MTKQEQRIAIAEACGWTIIGITVFFGPILSGAHPNEENAPIEIPHYVDDLNAMHIAEEILNERQIGDYHFWILDNDYTMATQFVPGCCPTARQLWFLTHATAAQRSEAFLRTIGKWTE